MTLMKEMFQEKHIQLVVWLGHIIRMDNSGKVKMDCNSTPEGTGSRGRPRLRCMDSVRMDQDEFGIRNRKEKSL